MLRHITLNYLSVRSIIILMMLLAVQLNAQQNQIIFERIEKDQGLISGNVNDIIQDSTGFIWMATENGLCSFDGYNFTYFKNELNNPNSLSYNHVFTLLEDNNGIIWVGTLGGGLNKFNTKTGKFQKFQHNPKKTNSLSNDNVYKIFRDSKKRIWISTLGGGLNLFDPVKEVFTRFTNSKQDSFSISSNMVSAVYEDKQHNLWFGTYDNGLNFYNEAEKKFIRYKNEPRNKFSLSHNQVMDFCEDEFGRFWVATFGGGLNLFDRNSKKFSHVYNNSNFPISPDNLSIRKMFEDNDSFWIATYNGLFKFDKKNFAKEAFYSNANDFSSINDNKVRAIFKDRTGVLWFGSISGANKFDTMKKKFSFIGFNQAIRTMKENQHIIPQKIIDERILWAGPNKNSIIKSNNRKIKYFANSKSDETASSFSSNIFLDESDRIWIGSYNGIHYFDPTQNEFSLIKYVDDGTVTQGNNFVKWFYVDNQKRFWCGTYAGGITIFDPNKKSIKKFVHHEPNKKSLSDSRVNSVYQDSKGIIWIATFGGLNIYNEAEQSFKRYVVMPNDSNCISNDRVYCIHESKNGELWIGTYQGLNRYNRTKDNFEKFTTANGLSDNTIYSIQEDSKGNLWIRTNEGISKFDPSKKIFKNYSAKDGLAGMELNGNVSFQNKDGKMFFGSSKGFVSFYPNEIFDNPKPPEIVFTKLLVMDEEIKAGSSSVLEKPINDVDEVTLSYKDKVISIEFAALHFAIPQKNKYAYKLDGILDKWVYVGAESRLAKFTNLNPGKYFLKVKASNNDDVWSNERTLAIIISPPYYETWWFRTLAFIAFLGLVFLFYEIRLNRLIGIERTRSRIARNLHDEVGGTLSSIQYFVRAVEKELSESKSKNVDKYLNLILESSATAQDSIKDLIWTVNPEEDGLKKFIIKFHRYASDLLESKEIKYTIDLPIIANEKSISMETRQHLWCICKEVLTNIVRHSSCANVTIISKYDGKKLDLTIADDGIGFNESEKTFSNGLVNIKNRAEALKADYNLQTSSGGGTKWTFSFKV